MQTTCVTSGQEILIKNRVNSSIYLDSLILQIDDSIRFKHEFYSELLKENSWKTVVILADSSVLLSGLNAKYSCVGELFYSEEKTSEHQSKRFDAGKFFHKFGKIRIVVR